MVSEIVALHRGQRGTVGPLGADSSSGDPSIARANIRSTVHVVAAGECHEQAFGGPAACFQLSAQGDAAIQRDAMIGLELSLSARTEAG